MRNSVLLFLVLWTIPACRQETELTGQIVGIADGDTFTLLLENNEQVRIRLHGIDTPERGQPYSRVATDYLGELLNAGKVVVKVMDTDRYGRTIGMVLVDGRNVNEELIRSGYAWHYKQYDENEYWAQMENEAREAKRGLWQEAGPTPPWVYRRMK